jgi:5-formyltetrahydrofolate cyclo-ligase
MVSKNLIRETILKKRSSLSSEKVSFLSEKISSNFLSLPEVKKSKTIGIYLSYSNEADTRVIVQRLLETGKRVCVPVMDFQKNCFDFCLLESIEKTSKNKIGISEPSEKIVVSPKKIDLFAVPGIAFDLEGNRVGSGKGYYDRFFSENKINSKKIGIAFEFQVSERIPCEKHDVKMDVIVTENAVLKF